MWSGCGKCCPASVATLSKSLVCGLFSYLSKLMESHCISIAICESMLHIFTRLCLAFLFQEDESDIEVEPDPVPAISPSITESVANFVKVTQTPSCLCFQFANLCNSG